MRYLNIDGSLSHCSLRFRERRVIHFEDLPAVVAKEFPERVGFHGAPQHTDYICDTALARERAHRCDQRSGARRFVLSLTGTSKLLETFAAQAVIAIENVRLFQGIARTQFRAARSIGASDRHSRSAGHHQPIAHGRAAGA